MQARPGERVEPLADAFQALAPYPRITAAMHLIKIHNFCATVLQGWGGPRTTLLGSATTSMQQVGNLLLASVQFACSHEKVLRLSVYTVG